MTEPSNIKPIIRMTDLMRELLDEAYKGGREEVVEWVENNHRNCPGTLEYLAVSVHNWQSQLKEWGLSE